MSMVSMYTDELNRVMESKTTSWTTVDDKYEIYMDFLAWNDAGNCYDAAIKVVDSTGKTVKEFKLITYENKDQAIRDLTYFLTNAR